MSGRGEREYNSTNSTSYVSDSEYHGKSKSKQRRASRRPLRRKQPPQPPPDDFDPISQSHADVEEERMVAPLNPALLSNAKAIVKHPSVSEAKQNLVAESFARAIQQYQEDPSQGGFILQQLVTEYKPRNPEERKKVVVASKRLRRSMSRSSLTNRLRNRRNGDGEPRRMPPQRRPASPPPLQADRRERPPERDRSRERERDRDRDRERNRGDRSASSSNIRLPRSSSQIEMQRSTDSGGSRSGLSTPRDPSSGASTPNRSKNRRMKKKDLVPNLLADDMEEEPMPDWEILHPAVKQFDHFPTHIKIDAVWRVLYRILGAIWLVSAILYFRYRIVNSIAGELVGYRWFILIAEMCGSLSLMHLIALRWNVPFGKPPRAHVNKGDIGFAPINSYVDPTLKLDESDDDLDVSKMTATELAEFEEKQTMKEKIANFNPQFKVLVLIPCYSEDLACVSATAEAALDMEIPNSVSSLQVVILDDGKDNKKRDWANSMTAWYPNLKYSARTKPPPPLPHYGKSGNINAFIGPLLREMTLEEQDELLIIVFDADMCAAREYLQATMPYFVDDSHYKMRIGTHSQKVDVLQKPLAMVQTPQSFYNVQEDGDLMAHNNIPFFGYTLPAASDHNTCMCVGTNFIARATALRSVGLFPISSITEDSLLSMLLLGRGWRIQYHGEHLASGEAPEKLREIFQQRSRWTKGNFQILFTHNPLFQPGLTLMQRLFFFSSSYNYITAAFLTPMFMVMPLLSTWFDIHPINTITKDFVYHFLAYYISMNLVFQMGPTWSAISQAWVSNQVTQVFSFTFLKAMIAAFKGHYCTKTVMTFKVTHKRDIGSHQPKQSEPTANDLALDIDEEQDERKQAAKSHKDLLMMRKLDKLQRLVEERMNFPKEKEIQTAIHEVFKELAVTGLDESISDAVVDKLEQKVRQTAAPQDSVVGRGCCAKSEDRKDLRFMWGMVFVGFLGVVVPVIRDPTWYTDNLRVTAIFWILINLIPYWLALSYAYCPHTPRSHKYIVRGMQVLSSILVSTVCVLLLV